MRDLEEINRLLEEKKITQEEAEAAIAELLSNPTLAGADSAIFADSSATLNFLDPDSVVPELTLDSEGEAPPTKTNPSHSTLTPEIQGRYRPPRDKDAIIGEGGIGRVIRVYDHHLGRNIARKELLNQARAKHSRGGTSLYQRFVREARITAQLEHPSIVPVYELGETSDGIIYYTMQEVSGQTFKKRLQDCENLEERLQLMGHFLDFCQAIGFAHSQGIIHRDIKPENVMVDRHGQTIVLDWGLAKRVSEQEEIEVGADIEHEDEGKTRAGLVMGTLAYMSPEQAAGDIEHIDSSADVWALGIVLYEILTGEVPHKHRTPHQLVAKKLDNEEIPDPRKIEPKAPKELCMIAQKALTWKPTERYASASELADDVQSWQNGGKVSVYDYSTVDKVEKWFVNNRLAGIILIVSLIIITIADTTSFFLIREQKNEALAEKERAVAAEQKVESQRKEARFLALESKVNQWKQAENYPLALAYQRALIDFKGENFPENFLEAVSFGEKATFFEIYTQNSPAKIIPYPEGQVLFTKTSSDSVVVGYSNNQVRSYSIDTGELKWDIEYEGELLDIAALPDDNFVILTNSQAKKLSIRLIAPDGKNIGIPRLLSYGGDDDEWDLFRDITRWYYINQEGTHIYFAWQDQLNILALQTGVQKKIPLPNVAKTYSALFEIDAFEDRMAVILNDELTILDVKALQEGEIQKLQTVPLRGLNNRKIKNVSDILWLEGDNLVLRSWKDTWLVSLSRGNAQRLVQLDKADYNGAILKQIGKTDWFITPNGNRKQKYQAINWKTGQRKTLEFQLRNFKIGEERQRFISFAKTENLLFIDENRIEYLDVDGMNHSVILPKTDGHISTIEEHPTEPILIIGDGDGTLSLLDIKSKVKGFTKSQKQPETQTSQQQTTPQKQKRSTFFYPIAGESKLWQPDGWWDEDWYYAVSETKNSHVINLFHKGTGERRYLELLREGILCQIQPNEDYSQLQIVFANPCYFDNKSISTGSLKKEFETYQLDFPTERTQSITLEKENPQIWSHKDRVLFGRNNFIWFEDDCVHFWDWKVGKEITQCSGEEKKKIKKARLMSKANKVVALREKGGSNFNSAIEVWDLAEKRPIQLSSLEKIEQECNHLEVSQGNQFAVICANMFYIFDVETDQKILEQKLPADVSRFTLSPDGSLAVIIFDNTQRIGKVSLDKGLKIYPVKEWYQFVEISPDNQFVIFEEEAEDTKKLHVYLQEEMTSFWSVKNIAELWHFASDSQSIMGRKSESVIHSPMFNLERYFPSLYGLNQSNIRVCQDSLEFVYVTPFPDSESPWASEEFCSGK